MENWLEPLAESLLDCLKMLPFLYLAYLVIEYVEQYQSVRLQKLLGPGSRWGFAVGGALGLVPQCGFSAMAANLYAGRVITPGTLLAVFLATSDEALPLLLASGDMIALTALLAGKLMAALFFGFALDRVIARAAPGSWGGYSGNQEDCDCHDHREDENIFLAAARHTAKVFLLVLVLSMALSLVLHTLAGQWIAAALAQVGFWQVPLAALAGLVPNCAVSVLLTQLYADGLLRIGALFAGLCSGAGVGLIVLWRSNPDKKENARLTAALYLAAVIGGWVFGLLFN